MKKINVGLIGFGLSGRVFHSPLLKACGDYEILKVFSSRKDEVLSYLPNTEVVEDLDKIFNDDDIDLIILTGPNHTHFEQAKRALEKGKHVVVEKPFVTEVHEGDELIELSKRKSLILTVFQNRRWDCDFLAIKKLLAEKKVGKISEFHSHFDRWRPVVRENKWKESTGVATGTLYDLGSHLIDQCLELFGFPDSIFADLDDQKNNNGVVDYFHIVLKYQKMRAILHSSSFTLENPRFKILGDQGNFFKFGLDPQESRLANGINPLDQNFSKEDDQFCGKLMFLNEKSEVQKEHYISPNGEYIKFYQSLSKAIKENDQQYIPVSAKSALEVIKVIKLAIKSSEQKKWLDF